MQLLLSDLFCSDCRGYVHPFLDCCPMCGTSRRSRYFEARHDQPGEPSLTDDPTFTRATAEASTKLALSGIRSGLLGGMDAEGLGDLAGTAPKPRRALGDLAHSIASQLTYRGAGFGGPTTVDVDVRIEPGTLTFQDRKAAPLAVIDPALVLAAAAVKSLPLTRRGSGPGFARFAQLVVPHLEGHRLLVAWRAPEGDRQIAVGNRRGFFTSHARHEHYVDLAWWIGALAASSAQSRWRAVGADAHAVELGLERSEAPTATDHLAAPGFERARPALSTDL